MSSNPPPSFASLADLIPRQSWADESEGALPRIPHAFGAFGSVGPGAGGFGPPGGFAGANAGGPAGIFTSNPNQHQGLSFGTGVGPQPVRELSLIHISEPTRPY